MGGEAKTGTSATRGATPRARERVASLAGPLLVGLCGVLMLWWSWGGWPDVFVDFGRELYVPWQLVEGQTLYADVAYFNGPLSPYLNALWFRLFGVSLRTLVLANILILAGQTALLYWLVKIAGGRPAATASCLVFLTLFAFAQFVNIGNFNYVCPYSHELTHGIALSTAAIACLAWYQRNRRAICVVLAGLLLGMVFLTKIEVFAAAGAALMTGVAATLATERPARRRLCGLVAGFLGGAVVPVLAAFALLAFAMPMQQAWHGTLGSFASSFSPGLASQHFYRNSMGLLDPADSLSQLLECAGWYLLLFGPPAIAALLLRRRARWYGLLAIGVFISVSAALAWMHNEIVWLKALRLLPLIALIAGAAWAVALVRQRRDPDATARNVIRLSLVVFAALMLGKIVLNVRIWNYGFALAMPATLVLITALVAWLPAWIDRLGGCGGVFRAAALAAILVAVAAHLPLLDRWFGSKTHIVGAGGDTFLAGERALRANWILDEIERHVGDSQTLVVLPEGVMLNYLSRRRNPTPYVNFMPPELLIFGESRILASLEADPPDFVVLRPRRMSEYGYEGFGIDYALGLSGWLERNYEPVNLEEALKLRERGIRILLLRRGYEGRS